METVLSLNLISISNKTTICLSFIFKQNFSFIFLINLIQKIKLIFISHLFSFFLEQNTSSHININTEWKQYEITITGEIKKGNQLNQLASPFGIYVDDDDQCIYIADSMNDRIVGWKYDAKIGQVVAGGNARGNQMDQLNRPESVIVDKKTDSLIVGDSGNRQVVRWPRQNGTNGEIIISDTGCTGIAMDNNGDLYGYDWMKSEVRRWKIGETDGTIVAGGLGRGDRLNQLNMPTGVFVDEDHSVYVSERDNHRVTKWMKGAKSGVVVAGGKGKGNDWTQLCEPHGVFVDHLGNIYVVDTGNEQIVCWSKGSSEGRLVVGGNGRG
jgi:sugar lactone lactonase YvrE